MSAMKLLSGKKILFLCQKLYDYDVKVKEELEHLGAEVYLFENIFFRQDPVLYSDLYGLLKRTRNPTYKEDFAKDLIDKCNGIKFDYFFSIGLFSITKYLMSEIRRLNPNIETILYLWDSIAVWNYAKLISLFDRSFSFDRLDCGTYTMNYKPLFYFRDIHNDVPYSAKKTSVMCVASVGVVSQERISVLEKIRKFCVEQNQPYFFYIFYRLGRQGLFFKTVRLVKKLINKNYALYHNSLDTIKYDFLKDRPQSSDQYKVELLNSKCVIDIPVKGQIGLTMRSIESLAAGCKLITTNESIKQEDFYDENWIKIINSENPTESLNLEFIYNEPKQKLNMKFYRLDNWLIDLFIR